MRKIISIFLLICIFFSLCACSEKEKEIIKEIPNDCIISLLSFDVTKDSTNDLVDASNYFTQTGSNLLGLPSYMLSNNDIICTNDLDAQTIPYEELIYTADKNQRNLKYRYICYDDLDKFDFNYVAKQIKIIFGVDLLEYNIEENINTIKESLQELKNNNVIPLPINTYNDVNLVIGGAKQNDRICISIVGQYIKTTNMLEH